VSAPPELTPDASGVYGTPADVSGLRERARAGAATWKDIDLGAVRSKKDLMDAFAATLDFPRHFGANWDALEDCLGDPGCLPDGGYVIRLLDAARAQNALGEEWDTLIEILRESATWWKGRAKPFVVLIDSGDEQLPAWT
jgi:RNAse (barnase) inhibitor barstar